MTRFLLVALVLGALLPACSNPISFDPRLAVDFPDEREGQSLVQPDGTVRLSIRACVPHLATARARVTDLRQSGDAGAASFTAILVRREPDNVCDSGSLGAEVRVTPPATGPLEIEVAALGERAVYTRELLRGAAPSFVAVDPIRFVPHVYPAGGGVVTVTVSATGAAVGTPIGLRALPSAVQISRATAAVDARGEATFVLAVPEDVAAVWVEATLGSERASATVAREVMP